MAKKEMNNENVSQAGNKKLQTKDLIYAGAFGAIYIVLMLIIVMPMGMFPVTYFLTPFVVGVVCATVYELCVLKVHKFGAALILGIAFAVVSCSAYIVAMALAIIIAICAELVLKAGDYKSRKMYLLSYVVFNLNMCCPFTQFWFKRDEFLNICVNYYGQDYADKINQIGTTGVMIGQIFLALAGGAIGAFIANKLINKHFEKAGIV